MREFEIRLRSVQDVRDFVSVSTSRPFAVYLTDGDHRVNGKSFMEMFCLNFRQALTVAVKCSEEEFLQLQQDANRFLVK